MTDDHQGLFADENPFSTARIKPGAVEFQFCGQATAEELVTRLQQNGWRGQIVGPHGSGKSTLLRTLFPRIEAAGREVRSYLVRPGDTQPLVSAAEQADWGESTQVVVEGYELLGRRHQKALDRRCREARSGLLISCHVPQGLPTLLQTSITVELAISLVTRLLPHDCDLITSADVRRSFDRHGQNLRELLFEMYDLYEQRRPGNSPRRS